MEKTEPAPVSLYRTAGHAVPGHGPHGLRAAVHLVIDHSGSMRPYYAVLQGRQRAGARRPGAGPAAGRVPPVAGGRAGTRDPPAEDARITAGPGRRPDLPAPYVSHSSTVRHNVHRARTRPRTGTLIR